MIFLPAHSKAAKTNPANPRPAVPKEDSKKLAPALLEEEAAVEEGSDDVIGANDEVSGVVE